MAEIGLKGSWSCRIGFKLEADYKWLHIAVIAYVFLYLIFFSFYPFFLSFFCVVFENKSGAACIITLAEDSGFPKEQGSLNDKG